MGLYGLLGGQGERGGGRGRGCRNSSSQVLHSSLGAGRIPAGAARPGVGAGGPLKPLPPKERTPDTRRLPHGSVGPHLRPTAEVRLGWLCGMLGLCCESAGDAGPAWIWLGVDGPAQLLALGCVSAVKAFPWGKHQDPLQGVSLQHIQCTLSDVRWLERILGAFRGSRRSLLPISPGRQEGCGAVGASYWPTGTSRARILTFLSERALRALTGRFILLLCHFLHRGWKNISQSRFPV